MTLDKDFWASRYKDGNTPWDLGTISPPLRHYFGRLSNKEIKILVPGAGKAHEAVYLLGQGFPNVHVCDWAQEALDEVCANCPDFPKDNMICGDFFAINGAFDLIVEQTFFCAIPRERRPEYVAKVHGLLNEGGRLAGLLFAHEFPKEGPPFGGTSEEYQKLFQPYFEIEKMEMADDSFASRMGNELFFQMRKK